MFEDDEMENEMESQKTDDNVNVETDEMREARLFIADAVKRSQSKIFTEVVSITPEMAAMLLQRQINTENRPLSANVVRTYANDMRGGRWQGLNGQTIVVARDGKLNDGQHRLSAIVASGITVEMMIVFGAARKTRMTLDQNKIRTNSNYLAMTGIKNAGSVASIANHMISFEAGIEYYNARSHRVISNFRAKPTKQEIHEYALKNLKVIQDVIESVGKTHRSMPCTSSRLCVFFLNLLIAGNKWHHIDVFITQVSYGERLSRDMPAYLARSRMEHEKRERSAIAMVEYEILWRAWNAHVAGRKMSNLVLKGTMPELKIMKDK